MYQEKHHKRSHRRSRKSIALLVSLFLIVGVTIGGTVAFLIDRTGPVENVFTPSEVTTSVEETLENNIKSNVMIKNTGDTEAWIRAAVIVTWQDKDGNVLGEKPDEATDYKLEYVLGTSGTENNWVKGLDGYYYYTSPVAPGECTEELIERCEPVVVSKKVGEIDYYLTVEIIGSGVQSVPDYVVKEVWTAVSDVNADGILVIKEGGATE